jgi:hypothetical protein
MRPQALEKLRQKGLRFALRASDCPWLHMHGVNSIVKTSSSGAPNPSVEATRNGMAPRCAVVYVAPRGAMPLRAPHLQR